MKRILECVGGDADGEQFEVPEDVDALPDLVRTAYDGKLLTYIYRGWPIVTMNHRIGQCCAMYFYDLDCK